MKKEQNLEILRQKIDSIDKQILSLVNQRMEFAIRTTKYKKEIKDEKREKSILDNISNSGYPLLGDALPQKIYNAILEHSCKLQDKKVPTIGFQGVHGAYSQMAAKQWDENMITLPCKSFEEIFDGVQSEILDYGIVPIENNLGGVIGGVNALLLSHEDISIVGGMSFPVRHCLLCNQNANYRDLKNVYSHYQALAQCSDFIEDLELITHIYYDTAGAAKMISEKDPVSSAAIASELAAEFYGLKIIKKNITNTPHNRTRFFIIAKNKEPKETNRCSIVFSCPHTVGSLGEIIKVFSTHKINLTRLESFYPGNGDLKFFADFELPENPEAFDKLMKILGKATIELKILGKYQEKEEK